MGNRERKGYENIPVVPLVNSRKNNVEVIKAIKTLYLQLLMKIKVGK